MLVLALLASVCSVVLQYASCHDLHDGHLKFLSDERRLFANLTYHLEKAVRPVTKPNNTVEVFFGVTLLRIHDLDERSQELSTNIWLRMRWNDPQLKWKPSEYGGIERINIPSDRVWLPDIVLYNAAHEQNKRSGSDWLHVVVQANGDVMYVPHYRISAVCQLDMSRFPYDQHICQLKFGSWTYHKEMVTIQSFDGEQPLIDTSVYTEHREWEITDSNGTLHEDNYGYTETYQDVTYNIFLKRKTVFYTHVFVAPSVILALLTPCVFWLPPEGSEKMALGSGVMLGQVLLLVMLENYIPSAHPTVPIIGQYYIFALVLVAFSLVLAVMVRNVWSQSYRKRAVPACVRTVVLVVLGRALCVNRETFAGLEEDTAPRPRQLDDFDKDSFASENDREDIIRSFQRSTAIKEWRQLAVILDRLFFVLFLALVVLVTIAMLH